MHSTNPTFPTPKPRRFAMYGRALLFLGLALPAPVAPADDLPPRPDDFPRFEFPGAEREAELLSDYLWRHFSLRWNGGVLFNKEYLAVADLWMDRAVGRGMSVPIQEQFRDAMLSARMDPEGYVASHQHFAHAHDWGWPFPSWTQNDPSPARVKEISPGWHFQPLDKVPGWVGDALRGWKADWATGETAAASWGLENAESLGIVENRWRVKATGESPALLTPEGMGIEARLAPYMQLRWRKVAPDPATDAAGGGAARSAPGYIEWKREGDDEFSRERRFHFYPDETPLSGGGMRHSILPLHRHPEWTGRIARIRIALDPGVAGGEYEIDSFFPVLDTRHTINNPIFVLGSEMYFGWTGDLAFLRENLNRMRLALRHQQTVMGGLEHDCIRVPWPGHNGLPGFVRWGDGTKEIRAGVGIGNNYWDLMPFGGFDFYATYQYYAATLAMARVEEAVRANPGWDAPLGALAFDPAELRAHADRVKEEADRRFWSEETGRFVACVDADGVKRDYGYTFLNLDAIWYGIAKPERAKAILEWLDGEREVFGDDSTGADIYRWRFGPRATTRRNVEWYGHGWHAPESIPWGGQVQDGGAVLGFSFHDLWARLKTKGPDDAWRRLKEILAWEEEVAAAGGYRAYYEGGKRGTTLQGGGTAGGIGIDHEFHESSMIPAIVVLGFAGLNPAPDALEIRPSLPADCPEMRVRGVAYRGARLDVRATNDAVEIEVERGAPLGFRVRFDEERIETARGTPGRRGTGFAIKGTGTYRFERTVP